MIKLVFPGHSLSELVHMCGTEARESFALVLARPVKLKSGWRLLVESIHSPAEADYELRTMTAVRASATFRIAHEKRARREGLSIVYCHSHPLEDGIPRFSSIDDATEGPLAEYCGSYVSGEIPHVSLLLGKRGIRARRLGGSEEVAVFEVGRNVTRWFPTVDPSVGNIHDRQVRAFGMDGQKTLQSMRVAIVGLGGTGSVVAQQLAHLGVADFLLLDPEILEETNLNRVVGARPHDVDRPKVAVARRMILQINPAAKVIASQADVLQESTGLMLRDVDFVFCCTDSHGSRLLITQLAYQYFVPAIDMGTVIQVHEQAVTHYGSRVQMLAPGLACLVCNEGILDPVEVRWDLSSLRQRAADPYFRGRSDIKQPSVISLNSSAASQAVSMFLSSVTGIPMFARCQLIRGIRGDMRVLDDSPRPNCVNCSPDAYFGKGVKYGLPVRASEQ